MKKISTSQAAWALLTEGVTNARVEAHRLRHLLQRAQKLVEKSPRRDHLYEVAGDLILAAPDRLSAIEKSLDRTGYALAHMGQDFLKGRLGVTDRQLVEDTVTPSGCSKSSIERVASLYLEKAGRLDALPKKRWLDISINELGHPFKEDIWELYTTSYQSIGMHIKNLSSFLQKYKIIWLIDLDKDPKPDAFIAYKKSSAGNKLALLGTDGTKPAKRAMITKMVDLVKSPGWFIEASHKLSKILESSGVRAIDDPEVVSQALRKDIYWLGDGTYSRTLGSLGAVEKSLYGNPKT